MIDEANTQETLADPETTNADDPRDGVIEAYAIEDRRKWCAESPWNDERIEGPFDSRAEAIASIVSMVPADGRAITSVKIGRCAYADPGEFLLGSDMVDLLEEWAADNEWCWAEDDIYDYRPGHTEVELGVELRAVVRKHLTSSKFMMTAEEIVVLNEAGEEMADESTVARLADGGS